MGFNSGFKGLKPLLKTFSFLTEVLLKNQDVWNITRVQW